jgi:hypothetical protein
VMVARSLAVDAWREICASAETDGCSVVPPSPLDDVARFVGIRVQSAP